jgi:hypothetical protein
MGNIYFTLLRALSQTVARMRPACVVGSLLALLLLTACLSPSPEASTPASTRAGTAVATSGPSAQAQPGTNGTVMSGTITLACAPPPPDSTLFLGLASSTGDAQQTTCIDAERDPVDSAGNFRAQVACSPKPGQQLTYTLIIGPPGQRNWHSGSIPIPADLSNFKIDAQ